jgi:Family of unknown function (DUF5681)
MLKDHAAAVQQAGGERATYSVGYRKPPLHTRFKPGQSGNPSGRVKGSKNLRTLFHQILNEQISLREGGEMRKMTKAEAVMRGLIIGALKGDSRSLITLFRLAELSGQFEDPNNPVTRIERLIVEWGGAPEALPAGRDISTE